MKRIGEASTFGGSADKFLVRCCSKRQRTESGEEEDPNMRSEPKKIEKHDRCESGYSVDLGDLLFTPDRHFLISNNGQKVSAHHLNGKTILLLIVPIYEWLDHHGDILDVVEAYIELFPFGGIEFVFVPVYIPQHQEAVEEEWEFFGLDIPKPRFGSKEAFFNHLLSTIPFPAVPFSDVEACGDRVLDTFAADLDDNMSIDPHWVILDPTSTVVATRELHFGLFKLFGGAELYPLSYQKLVTLCSDFPDGHPSLEYRKRLISQWDQLLASPTRDYLLSSNGARVPISSLKGKLIGLYFCENVPCPPRMNLINKVYQEAKLRGYDFEIVQINFHYQFFNARYTGHTDFSMLQRYDNINWLTLPFKDPICRKLQRMFKCQFNLDYKYDEWEGDCLVIVDSRQDSGQVLFEFSGAEIIERLGIEGYPFTTQSLLEKEYTRLRKEIRLELLFPQGLCQFTRHVGGGRFDLVDDSQLKGKRVLVLFVRPSECKLSAFISTLKFKYLEQAQEDKFEVVYVSLFQSRSFNDQSFSECTRDMPWLVHPYNPNFGSWWIGKNFRDPYAIGASAFGLDGKLIAKDTVHVHSGPVQMGHRFPFISPNVKGSIHKELNNTFRLNRYYDEQCIYEE